MVLNLQLWARTSVSMGWLWRRTIWVVSFIALFQGDTKLAKWWALFVSRAQRYLDVVFSDLSTFFLGLFIRSLYDLLVLWTLRCHLDTTIKLCTSTILVKICLWLGLCVICACIWAVSVHLFQGQLEATLHRWQLWRMVMDYRRLSLHSILILSLDCVFSSTLFNDC